MDITEIQDREVRGPVVRSRHSRMAIENSDARNGRIYITVSPAEARLIRQAAHYSGSTMAGFIRTVVIRHARDVLREWASEAGEAGGARERP